MRSVVLKPSIRCPRCQLPPRWCVCPASATVETPLAIDVLVHDRERFRPSSTGALIARVMAGSRQTFWRRERGLTAAEVKRPGRELWILHPHGVPAPAGVAPSDVQVMLLDGAWKEATQMAQEVSSWGKLISLPMAGESRYWLRAQADDTRFSTAEALLHVLGHFGLHEAQQTLRLQFELHVYAHLRARGFKPLASEYLATSPIREAFPEFLAALDVRRPREA